VVSGRKAGSAAAGEANVLSTANDESGRLPMIGSVDVVAEKAGPKSAVTICTLDWSAAWAAVAGWRTSDTVGAGDIGAGVAALGGSWR
jgi:hypothetical protein